MKKKIQNSKKPSIRSRVLLTISLLTIVRLGSFIPLPYIDRETFTSLLQKETSSTNALAQVINTFSGGSNNSFGLLSLGILPYINASIIIQLLTTALPSLSKMVKEEGEYGRRILTDYTRYLTFFWAVVESIGLTYSLKEVIFGWSFWTAAQISLTLITGSMIILWFSELITENGLGNGSSLLICFNIISTLPDQIKLYVFSNEPRNILFLGGIFLITTVGCICINEAHIRIPLVSARQLLKNKPSGLKGSGNASLPLRLNQAGVMPLVFTSYAMVILTSLGSLLKNQLSFNFLSFLSFLKPSQVFLFWGGKIFFWGVYASLIFFFTYFYSTIVLDPQDVAERFRKSSVVILGIRPGKPTKVYLQNTLRYLARVNAIFLISNIIGIQILESLFHLNLSSVGGLGFTSQLILINVLIDTLKRIRSFLNEDENLLE